MFCMRQGNKLGDAEGGMLWTESCPPQNSYVDDLTPKVTVWS